ncbi:MAG: DUF1540 domain-containing protein [Chitinispirillaceae bacterium]|nr:DUF1540 domain-containing protein [Chitinispirillaceae bacterium]
MQKSFSPIVECDAIDCAYNKNRQCHTHAITVGDEEPCCDTFYCARHKGGIQDVIGGVGACKVEDCVYNKSLECTAKSIHIVMNMGHPDCGTYKKVQS